MAFIDNGPTIRFSQLAWQKMWALCHACDSEISWLGIISTDEEKDAAGVEEPYYFTDVYVVEQECDGTNTDMSETAVGDLVNTLMNEGIDPGRIKLWGHTHPTFSTEFSGKDEACIEKLQLEPLVSIILNKKGEVNLRLDQWEPFRHSFKCDYIVDEVQLLPDGWGASMVKEYVKPIKRPMVKYSFNPKNSKNSVKSTSAYGWYDDIDNYSWGAARYTNGKKSEPELVEFDSAEDDERLSLFLPPELHVLQESFEDNIITLDELLTFHAKWYAHEMSEKEIEEDIFSMYGAPNRIEDDDDDEEDINTVIGDMIDEETKKNGFVTSTTVVEA
tara:strand:+ start:7719 stop:8711 length:993 start_codon:yes stop_codon:yes gene_type:complete